MSEISRAGGPLPVRDTFAQAPQDQVATVQVGESKLSDVAKRLGLDHQELQKANPQISDANLKAGQEIRLPQNPAAQGSEQAEGDDDETVDHPVSQLGDPMTKNFVQAKLEDAASRQKTDLSDSDLAHLHGGASNEINRNSSHWKDGAYGKISPGEREYKKYTPGESEFKKYSPVAYQKDTPQFQKDNATHYIKDDLAHVAGHDLTIMKALDKSAPLVSEHFGKVKMEYKPQDKISPSGPESPKFQEDNVTHYIKDDLAHVAGHDLTIMKAVDKSSPLVSDQPSENVSLNFSKIKVEYKPQDKIAPSGPEPPNPALLKPIKEETSSKGFDIQTLKPW